MSTLVLWFHLHSTCPTLVPANRTSGISLTIKGAWRELKVPLKMPKRTLIAMRDGCVRQAIQIQYRTLMMVHETMVML